MVNSFEECLDILKTLDEEPRYWGKYKVTFFEGIKNLSSEEKLILKRTAPANGKFNLMHQYVSYVTRKYPDFTKDELPKKLENTFWLLWLEDLESGLDYRDTIIGTLSPFLDASERDSQLRSEVMSKFPEEFSDRLLQQVENLTA